MTAQRSAFITKEHQGGKRYHMSNLDKRLLKDAA